MIEEPRPVERVARGAPADGAPPVGLAAWRWLVAGLVTIVAAGALVVGLSVLAGRPVPEVRRWIPAEAFAVAELRPELPGDQRARLGTLLAHFPGFRDQSLLDRKLDEAAERLLAGASGGALSYTRDIEPWLAGPLAVASLPGVGPAEMPAWLLVATTDGTLDASGVLDGRQPCEAPEVPPGMTCGTLRLAAGGPPIGLFVDGRTVVLGTPEAVRRSVAVRSAASGLDTDPAYAAALASLSGDRLATLVARPAAAVAALSAIASPQAMAWPGLEALPAWVAWGVRAEDDALVVDLAADTAAIADDLPVILETRSSRLATRVPADALAFVEVHLAEGWLTALADAAPPLPLDAGGGSDLDPAVLLDGIADGVTDAGLVLLAPASAADAAPRVALLLVCTDADRARGLEGSLRNLGGLLPVPDMSIETALDGSLVLVGLGEGALDELGDPAAEPALADDEGYRAVMARAGEQAGLRAWLDLAALIDWLAVDLEGAEAARWQADLAPYAAPLRDLAVVAVPDPAAPRTRIVLRVE
jgi:hypothetical protein